MRPLVMEIRRRKGIAGFSPLRDKIARATRAGATWLLLWVTLSFGQAAEIFVAPDGLPTHNGSEAQPLDLETALIGEAVLPGDTIWLRGGVYRGYFASELQGAEGQPIVVRQYPGERTIIDGSLVQNEGGWVTYWGFELHHSRTNRLAQEAGPFPAELIYQDGISLRASHLTLVNLIVHDVIGNGLAVWSEAPSAEIYGCLLFHNGWQGSDRAHGHGIYCQNEFSNKHITDNIVFNNYGNGIQLYGTSEAYLRNFIISGNIAFNNGILSAEGTANNLTLSGGTPSENIIISGNATYNSLQVHGSVRLGSPGVTNLYARVQQNYFMEAVRIADWRRLTVRGNTIAGPATILEFIPSLAPTDPAGNEWDQNEYYSQELGWEPFSLIAATAQTFDFPRWQQATGFDQSSLYFQRRPSGVKVMVRPNRYEPGRAHIAVYNWDQQPQVTVDVDSMVPVGAWVEVRNAQDFFAPPVFSGLYTGQPLLLPMQGLSVIKPHGKPEAPPPTGPEFNAFVLLSRQAPVLAQVPIQILNEGATLKLTNATTFVDWQTRRLRYTLLSGPPGVLLNEHSGALSWRPVLDLSPTTNTITVQVADGALPQLRNTLSFTVIANAVRRPPTLIVPPHQNLEVLTPLTVTNQAYAGDHSVNRMTFALVAGPEGIRLSPYTGVLRWLPTAQQAGTNHQITVQVTDDGSPQMSATNSFQVRVYPRPTLTLNVEARPPASIVLQVDGLANRPLILEYATNLTASSQWTLLLQTNTGENIFTYVDIDAPQQQRFYRLR